MSTKVIMPQMGESIFEGTITKWLKKPGDSIDRDEALFEISTDKVDTEIPSPASGKIEKIEVQEGETVPINTVVAYIASSASETDTITSEPTVQEEKEEPLHFEPVKFNTSTPAPASPPPAPAQNQIPVAGTRSRIFSSPLVRRMAREQNIDLSTVQGSGYNNRISKKDLLAHINGQGVVTSAVRRIQSTIPAITFEGDTKVEKMSQMRKKIAEHMVMSKHTSPHVTTVFEVDMSNIMTIYAQNKASYLQTQGTKLTLTHFIAKGVIDAIKEFPIINSSVDGDSIVYKRFINLGIAVAIPEGLIVPVVKHAEDLSFLGLARGINDVAERSRTKKLTPDDVTDGTFTITNPGIYGGLFGTPIISQPQVAILGIGAIKKRAIVINDAIAIRSMACIALSFDHRVIDGAIADQFMARLVEMLETWTQPL